MEEGGWKRDETPYLIFRCPKCQQYSYVKTTQKAKKCLRCNRTLQVQRILGRGIIVKGMTAAVERVKNLQNELARNTLGREPDLVSEKGFSLPQKEGFTQASEVNSNDQNSDQDKDYYPVFLVMLSELNSNYKKFPRYMIDIMAEERNIPHLILPLFMRKAFREGILIKRDDLYRYYQKDL